MSPLITLSQKNPDSGLQGPMLSDRPLLLLICLLCPLLICSILVSLLPVPCASQACSLLRVFTLTVPSA